MLSPSQNSSMDRIADAVSKWKNNSNLLPGHRIASALGENLRYLNSNPPLFGSHAKLMESISVAARAATNQRMIFEQTLFKTIDYSMLKASDFIPPITFSDLSHGANFKSTVLSAAQTIEFFKTVDFRGFNLDFEANEDTTVEDLELDVVDSREPEKKIILLHEANRLRDTIHGIYRDNSLLYKIKAREFEEVVAELLRNKNFEVELTKQTRDGGFDLIAVQNLAGVPLRFLVECKRYREDRPIGVDIIRSFSNVIQNHDANMGLLFTTSYFSPDARQHAEQYMPYRLDFKDKQDILSWVKAYTSTKLEV